MSHRLEAEDVTIVCLRVMKVTVCELPDPGTKLVISLADCEDWADEAGLRVQEY